MTQWLAGDPVKVTDSFDLRAFTPTWTGVTLGSGASNEGWYQTLGQFVMWGFRTQFGTSPSFSTTINLDLPVACYVGGGSQVQACLGTWNFRDNSPVPPEHYSGTIGVWSSSGLSCAFSGAWNGTVPKGRIAAGVPVTVAIDDVLSGGGCYRAA